MQVGVGEVGVFELDVDLSESVFGVGLMLRGGAADTSQGKLA